jgi:hypothetical protein
MAVVGCRSRAKQRWCVAMCRQRAPEVEGHSHADSKVGRVPRGEVVVASKLQVAQLVVPVRGFRSPTTIGIATRRERAPKGAEPAGPAGPGGGAAKVMSVRVRQVAQGRSWTWGRDRVRPGQGRGPSGPA